MNAERRNLNVERRSRALCRAMLAVIVGWILALDATRAAEEPAAVIVAIGAPGAEEYKGVFEKWAGHWKKGGEAAQARLVEVGAEANETDSLAKLRAALDAERAEAKEPLWIVLLGHGTYDGKEPKFNLRGDDLGASELAERLRRFRERTVIVVCGFSASGAFLKPLSAPGRVIVCATRSGRESNFAWFGGYFSEAIASPASDLDKDGATSVLEAWLAASRRVEDFYKNEGRLATEHALLEDNEDGLGTPPNWFSGVRAVKRASANQPADGARAHQLHLVPSADERALSPEARQERDAIERELVALREKKATMGEPEYFAELEAIMLRLAQLYREKGGR